MKSSSVITDLLAAALTYRSKGVVLGYHLDLTSQQILAAREARDRFFNAALRMEEEAKSFLSHPPAHQLATSLGQHLRRCRKEPLRLVHLPGPQFRDLCLGLRALQHMTDKRRVIEKEAC